MRFGLAQSREQTTAKARRADAKNAKQVRQREPSPYATRGSQKTKQRLGTAALVLVPFASSLLAFVVICFPAVDGL